SAGRASRRSRPRQRGRPFDRRRSPRTPGSARSPRAASRPAIFPAGVTTMLGMSHSRPSASFSATIRVFLDDRPGAFADLARAIADAGGNLGAIDLVRVERTKKVRDVTVDAASADHMETIVAAVRSLAGVEVEHVSDRTFLLHLGGKIEMASKAPLKTRDDLSMAYTPGVARVCNAIAEDPAKVWNLTIKSNTVAVVTDVTAVLGLGDMGPRAAMPLPEGTGVLVQ